MEDLIEELLQKNGAVNQDTFYRQFSCLDVAETNKANIDVLIAKLWELIQRDIISKNILYLSLLQSKNIDLLEKCISYDKSVLNVNLEDVLRDPYLLFDYTVHTKKHWLYLLFKTNGIITKETLPKIIQDKYSYLQIIRITNECGNDFNMQFAESLIKNCNNGPEEFWIYYVKEIDVILKILAFCKTQNPEINDYEFLTYASQNCFLEVGSEYLDLHNEHLKLEQILAEFNSCLIPHQEDLPSQIKSLTSYSILAEFLKLIIPYKNKCKNVNVNSIIEDIQEKLFKIEDHSIQIQLLQSMFASIFIKHCDINSTEVYSCDDENQHSSEKYICNEKEIQIILFALRSLIEDMKFKKLYEGNSNNLAHLEKLHKLVRDATWRLELITNVVDTLKCQEYLLYYMLAEPESLIRLCLKNNDFIRASQVLKIFELESTPLAKEITFSQHLQELKETFSRTVRIRNIQQGTPDVIVPKVKLQFDDIVEDFFRAHPINDGEESDRVIQENVGRYPFLEHYKSDSELVMNILDLAITQTRSFEDSRALLHLASKYNNLSEQESTFSTFGRKLLILFNEIAAKGNLTLSDILLNPDIVLDFDKYKREEAFYTTLEELYTEFCESLLIDKEGVLNKDHASHKIIQNLQKHCNDYFQDTSTTTANSDEFTRYLQKLFSYLKAFSKVFYIEKDSSDLISNGKDTPYFALLTYNRSELMGKLLFQQNLDPMEFEKYFGKLKLDFLYHVAGNCFPTINLHTDENVAQEELYPENVLYTPSQTIIKYIMNTNRLLALILIEMYKIEDVDSIQVGESRLQHFINYLRLPKIDNLQALFKYNEIITALQNEIGYQKLHDFIHAEIAQHDLVSPRCTADSTHSLEAAEEIGEDELKATNWRKLFNIVDSIPEIQFKKGPSFVAMRDMVAVHLVEDAFECEYYKFTFHVWDRNVRTNLLLENMKTWPEDFCIESIKSEITRFDQENDEIIEELKVWLKHIEHSKKVMAIIEVKTWADMYDMCAFQPKEVLHKLLASKKIDVLLEFIELHEISDAMLLCIDEEFLEDAFEMGIELTCVKRLLKFLPQDHAVKICRNLLDVLKNVQYLQFLTNYLMKHTDDDSLRNIALSLRMLSVFTHSEFDQQLLCLLRDPMSIIEVLVMNTKFDKLAAVLDIIKLNIPVTEINDEPITVEKIDELLRHYAEKSLDFRVIAQPNPRLLATPEHKLLQTLDSRYSDSEVFVMPEEVPSKDQWVGNTEVIVCMCCQNAFFSMFNRRHHCRRCGRVVCSSCSKKRMIVPTYGDILVRVCSDCYEQTFKDYVASDDTTSTRSGLDDFWILTNDPEHNRIVREEFSYEFAPSVSLCLSLMKFHSTCDEYSKFLLEQCDMLLKLLIPNQEPLQEIDYMLVIRMLKSLALAAKMVSQDTSLQFGSSSADRILTQAELLGLLAERGCLNLLPTSSNSSFIDAISLMRLTDKLLEREQWNLALEVSTKAGIDKSGVFVAWGKSCLKAGSLAMAREKFSKCLDKNPHHPSGYYDIDSSSLKVIKNPPLLNEIIRILESKKEPIDKELISDHQKFLGSTMTLNSITSTSQLDGPIFVLNKLKNLKNIENGYYSVGKRKNEDNKKPILEDIIYDECVYYLNKYGTCISLVEFHIKYGHFNKALQCVIKKQLPPEGFVEVYIKCLKEGYVKKLHIHMSEIDSTLGIWQDHLRHVCAHLEKQNLLNSLYQLQQYIGDYVRAAMTCFRFYEEKAVSFTDLVNNSKFLTDSQEHLNQAKEQEQWVAFSAVTTAESEAIFEETNVTSPLIKKMSNEEIEKHTATIKMQCEVTQFLANCERNGVMPMAVFLEMISNTETMPKRKTTMPTLFGSADQRKYLAVLCMICGETIEQGFELGQRIVNEFKLKPITVYKEAVRWLTHQRKVKEIGDLVGCIQGPSGAEDALVNEACDEMLCCAVATLKKQKASKASASKTDVEELIKPNASEASAFEANVEELIKLISDKGVRITAYIEANKLNAAYYWATKYKRIADLKKIMRCAELSNETSIIVPCQKAIQKLSQPSKSTANNN